MNILRHCLLAFALILLGPAVHASVSFDLPACDQIEPGKAAPLTLGLVQPGAAADVVAYAVRLAGEGGQTGANASLHVCEESWRRVLPRWVPWASEQERGYGFGLFFLGFILTALILARTTPRSWWRRPTALGLGVFAVGSWGLGATGMALFHLAGGQHLFYGTVVSLAHASQAPQWSDVAGAREVDRMLREMGWMPAKPKTQEGRDSETTTLSAFEGNPSPEATPGGVKPANELTAKAVAVNTLAGTRFRVHHPLNLRAGPSVATKRLGVLQPDSQVAYAGEVAGDWWRVQTADGRLGWVSSLWLRNLSE